MMAAANVLIFILLVLKHVYGAADEGRLNDSTQSTITAQQAKFTVSTKQFPNHILKQAEHKSHQRQYDVRLPAKRTSYYANQFTSNNPTDGADGTTKFIDRQSVDDIDNDAYNDRMIQVDYTDDSISFVKEIHMRKTRDTSSAFFDHLPTPYNVSHLSEQCPYVDTCNIKGKELLVKNMASCCLPCSCDSNCGSIGNCCNRHERRDFMCHSPSLKDSKSDEPVSFGYYMIAKCLDGSDRDCKAMTVAPWGSMFPVYDPLQKMNYFNVECARCNGVKIILPWEIYVDCAFGKYINGNLLRALRGDDNEFCDMKFTPPKQMDIQNHVCSDNLISSCNITGAWKAHDAEIEEACHRWYSPVVNRYGVLRFANIYCMLCNGLDYDTDELCMAVNPGKNERVRTTTFLVDYRRAMDLADEDSSYSVKSTGNDICDADMVKHPAKAECRPVLCPNGFVNADGKCQLLTTKMLTDIYYVQLQLTPTSDHLLPASYIEGLSFEQRRNPATWLDTNGSKLDCYTVSFHKKDTKNGTFVKDLVVRAGQIMNRIRLDREIKTIRNAISKPWTISLQGEAFEFSVRPYRYQRYTPQLWTVRYDIVNLTKGIHTFKSNQKEEAYEEVVAYIQKEDAFIFKKTNFCNRVRLARSEWISGFQEIRLNISKEVYNSEKMLGDSEFDIFLDELREPMVEICVEDFNPGLREQKGSGKIGRNKATMLGRAQAMQVLIIEIMVCAILTYVRSNI